MPEKPRALLSPLVLTLYLLGVSVLAFIVPQTFKLIIVSVLFFAQFAVLIFAGRFSTDSFRLFIRLKFLFFFLVVFNALTFTASEGSYALVYGLFFSIAGCIAGLTMCLQIATVVLVSYVVRVLGDERSLVDGLQKLKVAPLLAYSIDSTLGLISESGDMGGGRRRGRGAGRGSGRGGGRGDGSGGGRRQQHSGTEETPGLIAALRKARFSDLADKISVSLQRAKKRAAGLGLSEGRAHDVSVIAGIGAVMMSFKLVKVLPGVPIFSGGKAIFFFPLYILASHNTKTRWGGTVAGTVMGLIAFLNGDGRYGIFEVAKHVAPGLMIDLVWPLVANAKPRVWLYSALGILAAVARTSTEFLMVFFLSPTSVELYLFPGLKLIPNFAAGALSGLVTYALITKFSFGVENQENGSKHVQSREKHTTEALKDTELDSTTFEVMQTGESL